MRNYLTYQQLRADLVGGVISCKEVVDHHLASIAEKNPHLNAFLEVFEVEARAKATEIDSKIGKGTAGKLAGLVVGIKDLFCYQHHNMSASSKILEGFESQITATAVFRHHIPNRYGDTVR